jgi:hypothetical protein
LLLFERVFSTTERRESELFVVGWGEHVQGGVPALTVVERLDVFEPADCSSSLEGQLRRLTSSFLSVAKNVSATALS